MSFLSRVRVERVLAKPASTYVRPSSNPNKIKVPPFLFHETLRANEKKIKSGGLRPRVGSLSKEKGRNTKVPLIFLSDPKYVVSGFARIKKSRRLGKLGDYLKMLIADKLSRDPRADEGFFNARDLTSEDFEKYGMVCAVKTSKNLPIYSYRNWPTPLNGSGYVFYNAAGELIGETVTHKGKQYTPFDLGLESQEWFSFEGIPCSKVYTGKSLLKLLKL